MLLPSATWRGGKVVALAKGWTEGTAAMVEGDPVEDKVAEEGCRTNEQDGISNPYERCVGDKGHHTILTI